MYNTNGTPWCVATSRVIDKQMQATAIYCIHFSLIWYHKILTFVLTWISDLFTSGISMSQNFEIDMTVRHCAHDRLR